MTPTNSVMTPMFNPADVPAVHQGYNPALTSPPIGMSSYASSMPPVSDNPDTGSRKTSISESEMRKNSLPSNDIVQDKNANNELPSKQASPTKTNGKQSKPEPVRKSSWLPGFIGKILRAPNQVHLPDDTTKTIYYDDKLGRWVNTDADEDASAASSAPPPMDSAFMNKSQGPSSLALPGAPSGSAPGSPSEGGGGPSPGPTNFRVAKRGRGRAAYVDVNRQSGLTKPMLADAVPPMMMMMPSPGGQDDLQQQAHQPSSLPPMMFNPGAVDVIANNGGAVDDGPTSLQHDSVAVGDGDVPESSTPSLGVPMMFNPSSMGSVAAPPTF